MNANVSSLFTKLLGFWMCSKAYLHLPFYYILHFLVNFLAPCIVYTLIHSLLPILLIFYP